MRRFVMSNVHSACRATFPSRLGHPATPAGEHPNGAPGHLRGGSGGSGSGCCSEAEPAPREQRPPLLPRRFDDEDLRRIPSPTLVVTPTGIRAALAVALGSAHDRSTDHGERSDALSMHDAPGLPDDARAFFTAWIGHSNAGEWDRFVTMMHPDIALTDPMMVEPARGREQALVRAKAQYTPFPDGRLEMIGDPFVSLGEPELAYRWRFLGTHLHRIDPPGFAPTGRRVEIEGTSVLRFRDQQVVDVRLFFDATDAARQLLAAPSAGSRLEQVAVLAQRLRAWWSRRSHRSRDRPPAR